jgi:hypothetical protein
MVIISAKSRFLNVFFFDLNIIINILKVDFISISALIKRSKVLSIKESEY